MGKKGFTLVELMVVVIIIGILASLPMPTYMNAVERARSAKAKNAIALIRKAEVLHFAERSGFTSNLKDLSDYIELDFANTGNDGDWEYTITDLGKGEYTISAGRMAGSYEGKTITLKVTSSGSFWDPTEARWPPVS